MDNIFSIKNFCIYEACSKDNHLPSSIGQDGIVENYEYLIDVEAKYYVQQSVICSHNL